MSEDSGGMALAVGINVPVSFCILSVGLSRTLQQILTDTESGTKILSIRVANSESAGHWYQWYLEGGNILHCWEK